MNTTIHRKDKAMPNPNKITLGGAIPPEALNGLAEYHDDLLKDAQRGRMVACIMDAPGFGGNHDRGETWPILRVRHWELIINEDDQKLMGEIMGRALAARTGGQQQLLPLPLVPGEILDPPEKKGARTGGGDEE